MKKVCPWCFPKKKKGEKDSDSDSDSDKEEEAKGLVKNEEKTLTDIDNKTTPPKAPKAPPPPAGGGSGAKDTPANAPTAEELDSEFTDEIQQLSHIISLMTAECVFAYENPFEIKLESQFAMMFDMELSFSYNSLKEAERQLMSALAEIFAKKESAAFFFKTLDGQMHEYVSGLSATEKFQYKQKSGFGRPDKLRLALEGEHQPAQIEQDCYRMCVEYWDNTRRANNPFRYFVKIYAGGQVSGDSDDIKAMKAAKA